jgi:hypothetical protein
VNGVDDILGVDNGVSVTAENLTFTASQADGAAATILDQGSLLVEESTYSGNNGPAIIVGNGTATVRNTTITANGDDGIDVGGSTLLENDTIASNGGRGISNPISPAITMRNSIVWGNALGDCTIPLTTPGSSSINSLDGDGSCGVGALSSTNPLLGPLAQNGGTTQTRALLAGSPAVNAGTTPCPATDERGPSFPRDALCDLGAYEMIDHVPPVLTVPSGLKAEVPSPAANSVPLNFAQLVSATDDDAVSSLVCTPASGSSFAIGTTTVGCTATDRHSNSTSKSFPVTVAQAADTNCDVDGKIDGRGSLLEDFFQAALVAGYRDDVCGTVSDARGDTMVAYNYDSLTGSANGLLGAQCRTDAFYTSDIPYDSATLTALNGIPGGSSCSVFAGSTPPYQPSPGPFPNQADAAAPIMTFPIGGTAVSVGINLQAADCGGTKPTSIQLTTSMISRLLGGDITQWDDPALRAGGLNAALANCHRSVSRVMRADKASTTQTLKNYLVRADDARATTMNCFVGGHWSAYAADAANTLWPAGPVCSPLVAAGGDGASAQLATCVATPGAICYADLPDMNSQPSLVRPSLRNATDTAFASVSTSGHANCSFGAVSLPGLTNAGAVGLDPSDTWAVDNSSGDHGDVTFTGTAYPACELSFVLVYTGLKNGGAATIRLGFHQRQTLYGYLVYALTSPGQEKLGLAGGQGLTSGILARLLSGFKANA